MAKSKFEQLDAAAIEEVMSDAPLKESGDADVMVDKLVKKIPRSWINAIESEHGKREVSPYMRRAIKSALRSDGLID